MSNQILQACVILIFNNCVVKNHTHNHDRSSIVAMSHYLQGFCIMANLICKLTLQTLSTSLQSETFFHLESHELFVENMTT
jgi:hypothetical protein